MIAVPLLVLLAQTPTTPAQSPSPAAAARPVVVLDTSLGAIKIALDRDKAPVTVDNFLQYVRAGHYDGTIFHRVIPGFMAQGGGMDADMKEKPTRPPIRNEANNGLHNRRGTVAMARTSDPNSASAQFFINVKDNLRLDYSRSDPGYAVFGEVVEGMGVVDRIVAVPAQATVPMRPVVIKSAREAAAKTPDAPRKPSSKASPKP